MKSFEHLTDLQPLVGQELGVSEWVSVDQKRIDQFAEATGDHQWIHIDPVRAAAGPFKTTVAHGFLTLSLLPEMSASAFEVRGTRMGVNYGLNKVRFPAPVPVGAKIRAGVELIEAEPVTGGVQTVTRITIEVEGGTKPACIIESVSRYLNN